MKNLWKITLMAATLTLFACGGNTNKETNETVEQEKQETQTTTEDEFFSNPAAESDVAYEALTLMIKHGQDGSDVSMAQFLESRKDYHGASELKFDLPVPTDGKGTYYQCADDYDDIWTVMCYPLKQGGWAVLAEVLYIVGDWGPYQYFAYRYVDGMLTPANELLPRPKFGDIYNDPSMLEGIDPGRVELLKANMEGDINGDGVVNDDDNDYFYGIYNAPFIALLGCQSIAMSDAYYDYNNFRFAKTVFKWDGERFKQDCPVEDFSYIVRDDGDEYSFMWNEEEGDFVIVTN